MNIYKISQPYNGYDTYDSAIVIAETEDVARNIHPSGNTINFEYCNQEWTNPNNVTVELISIYNGNYSSGKVLCASFNAG